MMPNVLEYQFAKVFLACWSAVMMVVALREVEIPDIALLSPAHR
jgi:hypothetical protein